MAVVRTVAGDIAPDDLGITLCHEHLLIDLKRVFVEPDEPDAKVMAHRAVELETLGWIRSNYVSNLDNLGLYVENEVIEEIKLYQKVGGATLVEVTPVDIGRNPEGLLRIAEAAGLNVVMGSGYYVHGTHPDDMDVRSEDVLVDEMTRDVTDGVGNTGIKSGIIGEIGCTWPLDKNERKVLRAAACAQKATGAALTIHPGRDPAAPIEILEVIDGAGATSNEPSWVISTARFTTTRLSKSSLIAAAFSSLICSGLNRRTTRSDRRICPTRAAASIS